MTAHDQARSLLRSPRRLALALVGVICVGLGLVGAVLPGLPTTIFLIAASYCFTRSCPWLEQRLIRTRVFRPYLPYLDGTKPMPRRARLTALGMMWTAVAVSLVVTRSTAPGWFVWALPVAAAVGTVAILRWRRSGA